MLHPIELSALPAPAAIAAATDEPIGVDPLDPVADPAGVAIAVAVADAPQPDLPDVPPVFSDAQQRDLESLLEAVQCPVRQRLLLVLVSSGRANVSALSRHIGYPQTTISHHLSILKMKGILFSQREGKCIWYELAPGCVRVERGTDQFSITVGRGNGVTVTLTVPVMAAPAERE